MKIIPEMKATFGETYFLGYKEKKKYDAVTNRKTDETEHYICKIASSMLGEQIDVIVPVTAKVQELVFNQRITLKGVVIDPYAKGSANSSFAQVILRCTAENIITEMDNKPHGGNGTMK